MILFQALVWNLGTCRLDGKGAIQVEDLYKNLSTDARHRVGHPCSSVEITVMVMEPRGMIVQFYFSCQPLTGRAVE